MKNKVIVVPEDGIIIVNDQLLQFVFAVPAGLENLHALQWKNGAGELEFFDDMNQQISGEELYASEVLPFVQLWEAEKARLEAEANKPPTLDEIKEAKIKEIKLARDAAERGGFEYLGKIFDSDSTAYQRMLGADNLAQKILAAGQPFSITWTVQDNSTIAMDGEQTLGMIPTFAIFSNALHEKGKVLMKQVDAAITVEDVQAIVWA